MLKDLVIHDRAQISRMFAEDFGNNLVTCYVRNLEVATNEAIDHAERKAIGWRMFVRGQALSSCVSPLRAPS